MGLPADPSARDGMHMVTTRPEYLTQLRVARERRQLTGGLVAVEIDLHVPHQQYSQRQVTSGHMRGTIA